MGKPMRITALIMALCTIFGLVPAQAAVFHSDVRVMLSIGKVREFTFTPVGEFSLQEDEDIHVGTEELTVKAVGGQVSITFGDDTVTAPSLTLLNENYGETTDYIRLKNSEHGTCTYLGNMTFDVYEGVLRARNQLPIEQYLYGVVPHEMSNSFPLEALKAQAVCARSYVMGYCSRYATRSYDIRDTSSDQVYRGYASKNTRAIAAVDATAGQVLTYEGNIIEAYYSASNGGQTERTGNVWENDLPYYTNLDDPYDLLNESSIEEKSFIPEKFDETTLRFMDPAVRFAIERAAYEAAGREVELVSTVSVTPKTPEYDEPSRSYTEADLTLIVGYTDDDGADKQGQVTVTLTLSELSFGSYENTLGRMSAKKTRLRLYGAERGEYYYINEKYPGWFITARRYGHGIGLSQRSAQERARAGQKYDEITSFYYVGASLDTVGTYDTAPKLGGGDYKVRSWGVSGISPGTDVEKLLDELDSDGDLSIINEDGDAKTGDLATGNFVRTVYGDGHTFFDLPIVIFGDLDGDGDVGTKEDILTLQEHLLRIQLISGPYLKAADVNHDGEVNLEDMIKLIRYSQGDEKISQED
ncbi:MAG: SpoIID/LytB domain-containing protein [Clostridia bacterium]|nr:SpoIID/LytB domain-containing protein [Clostridia bacterium]